MRSIPSTARPWLITLVDGAAFGAGSSGVVTDCVFVNDGAKAIDIASTGDSSSEVGVPPQDTMNRPVPASHESMNDHSRPQALRRSAYFSCE